MAEQIEPARIREFIEDAYKILERHYAMPLKTKITTVPERFKDALRDHNVKNSTTWREKMEHLGRDEKGRIKPLVPKPDEPTGIP